MRRKAGDFLVCPGRKLSPLVVVCAGRRGTVASKLVIGCWLMTLVMLFRELRGQLWRSALNPTLSVRRGGHPWLVHMCYFCISLEALGLNLAAIENLGDLHSQRRVFRIVMNVMSLRSHAFKLVICSSRAPGYPSSIARTYRNELSVILVSVGTMAT